MPDDAKTFRVTNYDLTCIAAVGTSDLRTVRRMYHDAGYTPDSMALGRVCRAAALLGLPPPPMAAGRQFHDVTNLVLTARASRHG